MASNKPIRLCFGEKKEIEVPHEFSSYSEVLNEFIKSTDASSSDDVIKMKLPSDHTVSQCQLILDFYEQLKQNPEQKKLAESEKKDKEAKAGEGQYAAQSPDVNTMKDADEVKKDADKKKARLVKLPEWAINFFKDVDKELLFYSAKLGNLLEARKFVDHITFFIADKLKSMNVIQMREYLNVTMDFEEGEFSLLENEKSWHDLLVGAGVVPEIEKKGDQVPE